MLRKVRSPKLLSLTTCVLISVSLLVCFFIIPSVSSHNGRLEQELAGHFLHHQTLKLDAAQAAAQVQQTGRLSLATADMSFELELTPHDMRAAGYRAEEFGAGGVGHPINTGPVRTFKGTAQGTEKGEKLAQVGAARFTIDDGGIEGLIITPAERYFVEPARNYSNEASGSDYVMYKESDVVASSSGACGVTKSELVNKRAEAIRRGSPSEESAAVPTSKGIGNLAVQVSTFNDRPLNQPGVPHLNALSISGRV